MKAREYRYKCGGIKTFASAAMNFPGIWRRHSLPPAVAYAVETLAGSRLARNPPRGGRLPPVRSFLQSRNGSRTVETLRLGWNSPIPVRAEGERFYRRVRGFPQRRS